MSIDWPYVVVAVVGLFLGWVARAVSGHIGFRCRTKFRGKFRVNPVVKTAEGLEPSHPPGPHPGTNGVHH